MNNIKAAVLGGILALVGVLAGEGLAHAECGNEPLSAAGVSAYGEALRSAHFCHTATSWAEQVEPGVWVGMCGNADGEAIGTVRDLAEDRCGRMVDAWAEDGITEDELGGADGMWEACMRLAAGGPYDTQSGAFWKVAR